MNLTAKRPLVNFSVALNIGFVVMAVVLVMNHPKHCRDHSKERLEILSHLGLPADVEESVAASMEAM